MIIIKNSHVNSSCLQSLVGLTPDFCISELGISSVEVIFDGTS